MGSGSSEESSPLEAPVDEVEPLGFEEADPSTSASEIDDEETTGGNDTVVAISVVFAAWLAEEDHCERELHKCAFLNIPTSM